MDENGYPDEKELETIQSWPVDDMKDVHELMAYIKPKWYAAEMGYWEQEGDVYTLHTAGWSGNEDIISALEENVIFWAMFWISSYRGGHFKFGKQVTK